MRSPWKREAAVTYLRVAAYNIEADIEADRWRDRAARRSGRAAIEAIEQQRFGAVQQPVDVLALEETSSNALTGGSFLAPVNVTNNADGLTQTGTVRDQQPIAAGKRFLRLRVARP